MYCRVFTSVLTVLVFASFSPVLFEHLALQLFLFDNAWCGAILPPGLISFFVLLFAIHCSYNSEQDSESWLANWSVLMTWNAPFSVFFTHWWHLSLQRCSIKIVSVFNFTLIYNVIKLSFEILIFSFALISYPDLTLFFPLAVGDLGTRLVLLMWLFDKKKKFLNFLQLGPLLFK